MAAGGGLGGGMGVGLGVGRGEGGGMEAWGNMEKVLLVSGVLREEGEGEEDGWGGEEGRRLVQLVVDQIRKLRLGGGGMGY